jgi:hypothetical protein
MWSSVFWNIMPCSPVIVNRNFGVAYRLYLQELRVSQAIYQHEVISKQSIASFTRRFWIGSRYVTPETSGSPRNTRRLNHEECTLHNHCCSFLFSVTLPPWRQKLYVLPKRQLTFTELPGVISQEILLFKQEYFWSLDIARLIQPCVNWIQGVLSMLLFVVVLRNNVRGAGKRMFNWNEKRRCMFTASDQSYHLHFNEIH